MRFEQYISEKKKKKKKKKGFFTSKEKGNPGVTDKSPSEYERERKKKKSRYDPIWEAKKPLTFLCNKCSNKWQAKKNQKKCPDCGSKDIEQHFDIFGKFFESVDEAKKPNYKKAKIGGKVWMRIWKENPELQDEMLKWRKGEEAKFVKKLKRR